MPERFSLKDHLFNKKSVTYLADLFYQSDNNFPKQSFIENVLRDFPILKLKDRILRIRDELSIILSDDYPTAVKQIMHALPPKLDPTKTDDDFGDFILAPLASYIVQHGCSKKYLNISIDALRECTKRFSAEDAIRYFINAFPRETVEFLVDGTVSNNYHVRRLSSEGMRPKLPWCINIEVNYKESFPILDMLFSDPTRYVTRSVANHMNDISKIDSTIVIKKLVEWKKSGKQNKQEMDFIINHSLRTLIKKGNKSALKLLGYTTKPKIKISHFALITPIVNIGGNLEFSFDILSLQKQELIIDYIVHHKLKSGNTNPKVFKIKKGSFEKGEKMTISKKQMFRIMTTKKLYPGRHHCEIQINGENIYSFVFNLVV